MTAHSANSTPCSTASSTPIPPIKCGGSSTVSPASPSTASASPTPARSSLSTSRRRVHAPSPSPPTRPRSSSCGVRPGATTVPPNSSCASKTCARAWSTRACRLTLTAEFAPPSTSLAPRPRGTSRRRPPWAPAATSTPSPPVTSTCSPLTPATTSSPLTSPVPTAGPSPPSAPFSATPPCSRTCATASSRPSSSPSSTSTVPRATRGHATKSRLPSPASRNRHGSTSPAR